MRKFLKKVSSYIHWQLPRVAGLPSFCVNYLFGRLWNDIWLSGSRIIQVGGVESSPRCAVYVIYPSQGVMPSHVQSLRYLTAQGLSPLVVSNLPLTTAEREQILPFCWRLLERSNFGYDFGGYREGVLFLLSESTAIERLFLFNDSVWFPFPQAFNWIALAEQLDADMVGAVSNGGFDRFLTDKHRSQTWTYDPKASGLHYCSFALCIGPAVISNPEFKQFWKRLKITNNKRLTIERGELGFSRWIIDRGYRHAATLDLLSFHGELTGLDVAELLLIARNLVIPEDAVLRAEQRELLSQDSALLERGSLIRFILWATADTGAAYALAHWSARCGGFGFLKKSPLWLSQETAELTEAVISQFGNESMLLEAKQLRRSRVPPK